MFFFFKQKTAYEMRISDWSSDVCSSDLFAMRGVSSLLDLVNQQAQMRAVENLGEHYSLETSIGELALHHPVSCLPSKPINEARSEERRVGKECVSTCRSRWSPVH